MEILFNLKPVINMLNKKNLVGHETIENRPLKILNNNFSLHKTNVHSFADFPFLFGFFQVNLFLFAGVLVLLYGSVTPVEADQCGYHYHTNDYFTIYYSTYYKRCYPIYYGYCNNTFWNQEIHGTNAEERLYYCKIISYYGK